MFYFLEIEKAFVNAKGANFEIMAKSKRVLTYIFYLQKFSKIKISF